MSNIRCRCPYLYGVLLIVARGINWDFPVSLANSQRRQHEQKEGNRQVSKANNTKQLHQFEVEGTEGLGQVFHQ